jgi:hypothetical protein
VYLRKLSWPKQRWATGAIRLAKLINEMWNINLLSIEVNRGIPILEIFIDFLLSFVLPLSCLDAFCLMLQWKVWLCRSPRRAVAMPLTLPISKSQRQLQIQSLPAEQRAVQLRSWVQICSNVFTLHNYIQICPEWSVNSGWESNCQPFLRLKHSR